MRILLVEDNKAGLAAVAKVLERARYSVDVCPDGADVLSYLSFGEYDCILLDLARSGADGLSVLQKIRGCDDQTPVLVISAGKTVQDRVQGLDCGADDYLVKPFALDELLARVRALLRRRGAARSHTLTAGDLVMDPAGRTVSRGGRRIALTAKEFAILEYLLRNKNRLLTRAQIVDYVWNYDFDCSSNIVDVYIRYLRSKIDEGFDHKLITTVRGSGYMLREPE